MKLWITCAAVAVLASAASAQNYNAFKDVTFSDVTVTQLGNSFTVNLGANPTVTNDHHTSDIKEMLGFWVLGAKGDVAATLQDMSGFMVKQNTGGGTSAYGWQTQNKGGFGANTSMTFTFSGFDGSKITDYGFKLHADGISAHVKIAKNQTVPEPVSMFAFASGCVVLIRKRKKK